MPFEIGQDFVPRPLQQRRRQRDKRRLAELQFKWRNALAAGDMVAALTAALDFDQLAAAVYGDDWDADSPANDG
jgi:hypothetical protein